MATFKAVVRTPRKDGFYQVYIRVMHNRKPGYIKVDKVVSKDGLDKKGDIKDPYVMKYCSAKILEYNDRLNRLDTATMSVMQIIDILTGEDEDICFSDFARKYIDRLKDKGMIRTSRNYTFALQSLELYAKTNRIMFGQMTSGFVNRWIATSLSNMARAKAGYPICMRQVFKAAILEYNDYDAGIIRIKTNPWVTVSIPKADVPEKKAITAEECREFFSFPDLPPNGRKVPLSEFGRDVCKMILCLGGINTVDLYKLKKEDYYDGIIHYRRAKTTKFRDDGAYFEMRVPAILAPLFEKYKNTDPDTEWLFNFHERMHSSDSFGANVNGGIHLICEAMGIPKEKRYCAYTFRHTFGTVAQNDCGATIGDVGFAMNHSSKHLRVTRGYIKIDFTPAWELNEKVVEFIFFSDKPSQRTHHPKPAFFRFSAKQMLLAQAFYAGKIVAEIQDTGWDNIDQVRQALIRMLPDYIPVRAAIEFRFTNLDKQETAVYEYKMGNKN